MAQSRRIKLFIFKKGAEAIACSLNKILTIFRHSRRSPRTDHILVDKTNTTGLHYFLVRWFWWDRIETDFRFYDSICVSFRWGYSFFERGSKLCFCFFSPWFLFLSSLLLLTARMVEFVMKYFFCPGYTEPSWLYNQLTEAYYIIPFKYISPLILKTVSFFSSMFSSCQLTTQIYLWTILQPQS